MRSVIFEKLCKNIFKKKKEKNSEKILNEVMKKLFVLLYFI